MSPKDRIKCSAQVVYNYRIYNVLKNMAVKRYRRDDDAVAVLLASMAAKYAWRNHPGVYSDDEIEGILVNSGKRILSEDCNTPVSTTSTERAELNIVHVITSIMTNGGHIRSLNAWIENDVANKHDVIVTDYRGIYAPDWMIRNVEKAKSGRIHYIKGSNVDKIRQIAYILNNDYDIVVMHHHPYDGVAIAAVGAGCKKPILWRHHSDMMYTLGPYIADITLCYRESTIEHVTERMSVKKAFYLPTPLYKMPKLCSKIEAREKLQIPSSAIVIATIGTSYKYTVTKNKNFYKCLSRLLAGNPNLFFVMASDKLNKELMYFKAYANRVRYIENFNSADEMVNIPLSAADVYIEGYPIGSQISLLEAAYSSIPVVLAPAFAAPIMTAEDKAFYQILDKPKTEEEYLNFIQTLLDSPELREELGARLSESVKEVHQRKWLTYVSDVYSKSLAEPIHSNNEIHKPIYGCVDEDVELVEFQRALQPFGKAALSSVVFEYKSQIDSNLIPWLFVNVWKYDGIISVLRNVHKWAKLYTKAVYKHLSI